MLGCARNLKEMVCLRHTRIKRDLLTISFGGTSSTGVGCGDLSPLLGVIAVVAMVGYRRRYYDGATRLLNVILTLVWVDSSSASEPCSMIETSVPLTDPGYVDVRNDDQALSHQYC